MNGKELIRALHEGKRVYGTMIASTSPKWMEVVSTLDIDCIFIDTEHVPMDWHTLGWMCRSYRGLGLVPIVRIPRADPYEACRVLDLGAVGIVASYVETAEQVMALRGAVKLRPLKGKKLEALLSGRSELQGELAEYIEKCNEDHVLLVNIESMPAVERLDEILAVPQLDGLLIGPHDLSCSLGIPEQYEHPLFDKTLRQIISKAKAKNISVGIHNLPEVEQEIKWGKAGMNMILRLADMFLFRRALHEDLYKIRKALGEEAGPDELGEVPI